MKTRFWLVACLVVWLLLFWGQPSIAQGPALEPGPLIYLQYATFDPLAGGLSAQSLPARPGAPADPIYLVQLEGPVAPEWKAALEGAGVHLLHYIPDYAFTARLRGISVEEAARLPHVRWIGPYREEYKLAESLAPGRPADAPATVVVSLFPGEARTAVEDAIRAAGGRVMEVAESVIVGDAIKAIVPASRIAELASVPNVAWIEPALPVGPHNDIARSIMGVTISQAVMAGLGTNLYGAGQIVDVVDSGLDTGNPGTLTLDLRDRFFKAYALGRLGDWSDGTWYQGAPQGGHGTHVAGSILGNGRNSGSNPALYSYVNSFAGVAPEARLIFQSVMDSSGAYTGVPVDLKQLYTTPHNDGARIHNSSWGGPTGGTATNPTYGGYDARARFADEFMWLNPTSLLVFSAGNDGVDANADGVVDQDSINSPATSKNALAVGATENYRPPGSGFGGYTNSVWGSGIWAGRYPVNPIRDDYISNNSFGMAAFSSRGPTDDGRIKPDLVAPGTDIISVRAQVDGAGTLWGVHSDRYLYAGGTSMAAPLTAGAAALTRQFYTQVKGHANPSAALLKATLINGALDISPGQYGTGAGREIPPFSPNPVSGFGRVNLLGSLALNTNERLAFWDETTGLATANTATYIVYLTQAGASGTRLSVTLCWTDYPAAVGVAKTLVNDLDLQVVGPDSTLYKGNGQAVWDRINNVEQVVIPAPAAGAYQITVRGFNVPQGGQQPYALVAVAPFLSTGAPYSPRCWLPLLVKAGAAVSPTATPTVTSTRPPATRTPTPTATATPRWVTLLREDFEDPSFPGAWQVSDDNGTAYGDYRWGRRGCRRYSGSWAGWAVGGGADGSALKCANHYPNHADSWMIYGPISLAGLTSAQMRFQLWMNVEPGYDKVCWYASVDGSQYYGYCRQESTSDWMERTFDLNNVPTLGNLAGRSQVWIALRFWSDVSTNYPEGAYVDDIELRGCIGACLGILSAQSGEMEETPASFSRLSP